MWKEKIITAIIVILLTIFLSVVVKSSKAATILSDGRSTITIDGTLWAGDAARLTRELGLVNSKWMLQNGAMLNIIIDSDGGSADVAQTMMHILNRWSMLHNLKIRTYTYTKALSGAGLIFLIGHERIVGNLGVIMIHEVWFEGALGKQFTLSEMVRLEQISPAGAQATRGFNDLMYQLLRERTSIPPEWVKDSRYITAEEAYKHNLATDYITF